MAFESDYETVLRSPPGGTGWTRRSPSWPPTASSPRWCAGSAACAGSSTLTGFALAVEIGDWHRFTGNSIGSFVGLVPTEYSSGASRVQGSITKTGNTHARRLLVEAAWHHRAAYRPGKTMRDRWELAPAAARARGDAGQPAPARPLGRVQPAARSAGHRQRRHRPRTGRLVLVPGRPGLTTAAPDRFVAADGGSSAWSDPRSEL